MKNISFRERVNGMVQSYGLSKDCDLVDWVVQAYIEACKEVIGGEEDENPELNNVNQWNDLLKRNQLRKSQLSLLEEKLGLLKEDLGSLKEEK